MKKCINIVRHYPLKLVDNKTKKGSHGGATPGTVHLIRVCENDGLA